MPPIPPSRSAEPPIAVMIFVLVFIELSPNRFPLSWIRRSAHAVAGQQRRDRDAENVRKNPSSDHASAHLWCGLYLAPSFDTPAANSQQ
jgi:hypothetical protein